MTRLFHTNTRSTALAFLLGLFITGSALLTPAVSLLANLYDAPNAAPEMLADPSVDPDRT